MSINLALSKKPGRYIGNEVNIIRKDADIKVALCFPDTYEIGMSHLGLKILYFIINNIPYASAERVFAPWIDYESCLRQNSQPLASLETKRQMKDFDIVGFTLQYELSYTNVLNMLDLGRIPIKTEDRGRLASRGNNYPLIIAGGPCAVNPLPLSPFIDAFVIGDGEEIIKEIIETYSGVRNKKNLLKALSEIKGIYVPSIHSKDTIIKRRIIENLDTAPFPDAPIVPFTPAIHDRISIEISRGCTRGCRFCQAGIIYRPLRERSLEKVLSLSQNSIINTGYEEISFTSLSTGDYSNLLPLIRGFNNLCSEYQTAISLPSLRVGAVDKNILREIKSVRKTGFTIAPEAGTKRLRNVINKDVTEEEYLTTLEKLFTEGWKSLKLYFMIGLPTETQEDIDGIINMSHIALKEGRRITGSRVNINVGISAFIPKPHTPFQWSGQVPYEELRTKQDFLRKAFKKKGINFRGQHVESSLLEAVFSRGDMECASLLETAWKTGCKFDGWSEVFDFQKWLTASEKTGIDLYKYASRTLDINSELPWGFIDTGISKEFLKSEYHKAFEGRTTPDCSLICSACGLGCDGKSPSSEVRKSRRLEPQNTHTHKDYTSRITHHACLPVRQASRIKLRVKFSKTGELRYLSHTEIINTFFRALRRAEMSLIYSKGFHPHPKISFGPALPVGIEGLTEYFDVELPFLINPQDFQSRINAVLPQGLKVLDAVYITENEKSINDFVTRYEYKIAIDKTMKESINSFMNQPHYFISREDNVVDIRPLVEEAKIEEDFLHLILIDKNGTKARCYEVLKELLQKSIEELQNLNIKRMHLYGYNDKSWKTPLDAKRPLEHEINKVVSVAYLPDSL